MKTVVITDETGAVKSQVVALMRYFKHADQTAAAFNEELKRLSPADKEELAIGAAKELGWTVTEAN